PQYSPMPVAEQIAVIYAVTKGYLDDVPVEDVRAFENDFLEFLRSSRPEALGKIREQKELNEEVEKALVDAIEAFRKGFGPAGEAEVVTEEEVETASAQAGKPAKE
ncbi:MAG: F0F1 ATP synthase subunit alpha, partial [Gemmatimonadetes bacterium]|nr:F0F1 ATP synthase subunit alpha [Gemmatimonadota bacterium]